MSEKTGIVKRIKSIKNIEIIVAILFIAVALIIFFGGFEKKSTTNLSNVDSFAEYVNQLENKMKSVISQIDGVGKVEVVISFSGGIEQEYVFLSEDKKDGDYTYQKNTVLTVGGKPVVAREKMPEIQGVIVVAEGADIPSVRLEIVKAVQALLEVPNGNIEVFKMS